MNRRSCHRMSLAHCLLRLKHFSAPSDSTKLHFLIHMSVVLPPPWTSKLKRCFDLLWARALAETKTIDCSFQFIIAYSSNEPWPGLLHTVLNKYSSYKCYMPPYTIFFCLPVVLHMCLVQMVAFRGKLREKWVRGLPSMMSMKISNFLTPSPPCHIHDHATYQYSCPLFDYPLPPSSADVIDGSPLT